MAVAEITAAASNDVFQKVNFDSKHFCLCKKCIYDILNKGENMYLQWIVKRFKCRKLKTLDGYIDFIKSQELEHSTPLPVENYKVADCSELFLYLDEYDDIKEKYSLNDVVKGDTDFEKALSLMNWLTQSTYYNGQQCLFHRLLPDDTLAILDFSYNKPFKYAINCRYKAIAFTDILIAFGIKAYPVGLNNGDHFVVHLYLSEEKKWVLFDPSFNTYFTDSDNTVLNAFEIRDYFINGKEPVINGYNFNGTTECIDIYKRLFIKENLINFVTWHDNSNSCRHSRTIKNRKEFDCELPDIN